MEILIFGDQGIPVIIFPTGKGRFYEWENRRMTEAVRDKIDAGHNQLFCIDSIIQESLLNNDVDAFTRVIRLNQYENYVIDEVFSFIKEMNDHSYKMMAGCEFGAYFSLLYLLKHPEKIQKSIAISGIYDIKPFLNGFYDDNVYFNNPVDFIPNLFDSEILELIELNKINLASCEGDENEKSTKRMSNTFKMRHIDHRLEAWQNCEDDRWTNWRKMFRENIV